MTRRYLGATEERKEREEPVGMGCTFKFHIPGLRYNIAFSVIFLKLILRSPTIIYLNSDI